MDIEFGLLPASCGDLRKEAPADDARNADASCLDNLGEVKLSEGNWTDEGPRTERRGQEFACCI